MINARQLKLRPDMKHLNDLKNSYPQLVPLTDNLSDELILLLDSVRAGGTILTCGNGGSAADAERRTHRR